MTKLHLLLLTMLSVMLASCSSVSYVKTTFKSENRYDPFNGEVIEFRDDSIIKKNVNDYKFIATIKARTAWCEMLKAVENSEVRKKIFKQTSEIGGTNVIINCEGCYCYGDVYRK